MSIKPYDIILANTIKSLRIILDKKQIELANTLGMSIANYCKIENGLRSVTITQLREIGAALGFSHHLLLDIADLYHKAGSVIEITPFPTLLAGMIRQMQSETCLPPWSPEQTTRIFAYLKKLEKASSTRR